MPTRSISRSQIHNINSGNLDFLDDVDNRSDHQVFSFTDLADTLAYVGALYAKKLSDQLEKADASSSGHLSDKTVALPVKIFGSVYTCEIETLKYAKFVDEGVNGWDRGRGSQFSFKKSTRKRGEPFTGKSAFVESMKDYISREGSFAKVQNKISVSAKESKRKTMTDATTRAAITAAYMIKRFGIKPTHYWRTATEQMTEVVKTEFAAALKVDIINGFGK